jgi:hypothetical protein
MPSGVERFQTGTSGWLMMPAADRAQISARRSHVGDSTDFIIVG